MEKNQGATDVAANASRIAADLRRHATLLDACLLAEKWDWARITAETIADISARLAAALAQPAPPAPAEAPAGKQPAGKRKWVPPTPEQVKETVLRIIGDRPLVGKDGPLVLCTFNGYHLKLDKARLMLEPMLEIVRRAHIIFFQETNVDALRFIARAAGYGLNVSHRNKREQACGFLFHPRVQWLGQQPVYHDYLLDIPGHPEFKETLRPAVQRRVKDLSTGYVFDVITFHGKSNVGGPDATRPIRRHQLESIVAELSRQREKSPWLPREVKPGPGERPAATPIDHADELKVLGPVVLGGDFNAPLELASTTEIEPLTAAGFSLAKTADGRPTHRYKEESAQFDGFFTREMDGRVGGLDVPLFPENKRDFWFYRELSDHMMAFLSVDTTVEQSVAPEAAPPLAEQSPNAKILAAAKAAVGQKMWLDYSHTVENGRLGCAASLTKVLANAGIGSADSDLVTDMVAQLKAAGFVEHPLAEALPGDVVYGTEPGFDATLGGGHAHIGVVGEDGTCYDNRSSTGLWSQAKLSEIFSEARFGAQRWVLRAPSPAEPASARSNRECAHSN